jgi:hypothetical protein
LQGVFGQSQSHSQQCFQQVASLQNCSLSTRNAAIVLSDVSILIHILSNCVRGNRTQKMDDVSVLPNWNENRPIIQKMALEAYKEHTKNGNALMPWLTLQLALAPVLESLVILDRYLFLIEHANVEAEIVPVFDVVTSPRNLALIARKITITR